MFKACGLCATIFCLLSFCPRVAGQVAEFTQNTGANRAVTIEVPLANYPGRGVSMPVTLRYSSGGVWRLGFNSTIPLGSSVWRSVAEAIYAEHSTAGWTTSLDVPKVEWPRQNDVYWYNGKPYPKGTTPPFTYRVSKLFMHLPDGSTHEMREQDAVYADNGTIDMVGTFYAVDSSRLRYDSTGQNTGILYMSDGTRYILGANAVQYIDRNGNTLNYDVNTREWTDTMGRELSMPWPANPGPGDYSYSLPGVDGSSKVYTIKFRSLSEVLTPGNPGLSVLADYYLPNPSSPPTGSGGANFPQTNSSGALFRSAYSDPEETTQSYTYVVGRGQQAFATFNPTVLSEIVLPNGQKYQFSYNNFGELDKAIYPTGAYQRYQYGTVPSIGLFTDPYVQGSRGVRFRWLSPNGTGGTDEAQWSYSNSTSPMTIIGPDLTRTEVYQFIPIVFDNHFGYKDSRQGMVIEERVYSPGGAMLRRTLNQYGVTSSVTNRPQPPNINNPGTYTAYRNPRLEKRFNIVLDTGGAALVESTIHGYIDNTFQFSTGLDRTSTIETHFATVLKSIGEEGTIADMPTGTTASRTDTVYLNSATYRNRNILGLPTSITMKGIVNLTLQNVAKTELFYDEVGYPLLTYGDLTGADYTNPGAAVRANVTTVRRYVDAALTTSLDTHAQFDQCGNLRSSWDARGTQSQTEYSSTYKHAYPTQTTTAVPDPSGTHGSNSALTSSRTFDYDTGLVLTTTDANLQVTSFSYEDDEGDKDPLNRLRKVTRPDGGWTKYSFGDTLGDLFTLTETRQDATRTLKIYNYVDAMGRPSRSFASEDADTYIALDTLYDQMGNVWKVSNPYRTTTLDGDADVSHTNHWTTSTYDVLGRIDTVTFPDASVVDTDYEGAYTTVTDQAGRQRRQKMDALGRVERVDEPNASGSLGTVDSPAQATQYEYDTQGNLVHITQGSGSTIQHRYFKYDALGRLTYEHQVEQVTAFTVSDPVTGHSTWTRKLVYDETIDSVPYLGLLTTTVDARNVEAKFRYDNLNRIYQTTFSDGTPTITNKYDQPRTNYFNKGHLTEALTAAAGSIPATGQLYNFDLMGRIVNSQQTVGAQSYSTSYSYNLADALTSQTYPSGRVVSYGYDDGGRQSQVSSGATVYASQFDYTSPTGLLKSVQLGNGAVESYVFNSRLQLQSLDLTKSGTQLQHYDYKYGVYDPSANTLDVTKNTGRIAEIEGFIATQKQWQQRFGYDSLHRLAVAREFRGDNSQPSYLVNYSYDVFGNRYQKATENANNPFTQVWVEDNHIDKASNRFSSGMTYDNAGNVTNDSKFRNRKFSYDANNRQKQSKNLDDTGAVDSVFDAAGQRVGTLVGGSLTNVLVYDAVGQLVAEYNTTTVMGGTQYLFTDHQGTPRVVTNSQGGVIARHDYLPFGEDVLNTVGVRASVPGYGSTEAARQKYAGMETNEATGMAHTLWRQYDSKSGRWTAPDPYRGSMSVDSPQSLNRYSYVDNDPLNLTDPTGLMPMLPDASTSWSDVANGFWGTSFGGPRQFNHISEALARHDSIIETGYDPGLGHYRGDVEVQYIPDGGGYSITATLHNPTPEDLGQKMDQMANSTELTAQRGGGRRPNGGRRNSSPKQDPRNWRWVPTRRGGGQWRYTGPRTWREGLGYAGGSWRVGSGPGQLPMNFRGLVQNRPLRQLTEHELRNAFREGFGFYLSEHAVQRLRDQRTADLGMRTLNDWANHFNGARRSGSFNPGRNDRIEFTHGRFTTVIQMGTLPTIVTITPN